MKKTKKNPPWGKIDWKKMVKDEAKKRFELASQTNVNELQPYIDRVLKALGHSEALVTDESVVWDMLEVFSDEKNMQKQLDKAHKILGVNINSNDLIITVAERLRKQRGELKKSLVEVLDHAKGKITLKTKKVKKCKKTKK